MPAVLFEHHQHGDVGFASVGSVDGANDTCYGGCSQICHHGQVRPCLKEVVVSED